MKTILIADDDAAIRLSLKVLLGREGYTTCQAPTPDQALELVRTTPIDIALIDMNYSRATTGDEGLSLLKRIKVLRPDIQVILMTAWGSIPLAVEGIHAGAFDFITKPWDNAALLQRIKVARQLKTPEAAADANTDFDRSLIIGRSPELMNVLDTLQRVAATDAPVLIMGENGTGKELIARTIHANSARAQQQLVKVNLGGISASLFESEMFGHRKGAFTGAVADRLGRFAIADKGTIFLDEIGELDLNCQVKLLRVLQEHTYEMLGDSTPRHTDVRVICATNADLPQMVRERTFREDLFYRINLITVTLPPLRRRRDDIPLLVDHFVAGICGPGQRIDVSRQAIDYLKTLPYPGNIRELKNLVERTILVNPGKNLSATDFKAQYTGPEATDDGLSPLADSERRAIEQALATSGGNLSRAAAILGLTRQSLYRRLEKYGIQP